MPPENTANRLGSITVQCIAALVLGIVVAHFAPEATSANTLVGNALRTLSRGWGNFFRLLAVPLTACLVFSAVLSGETLSERFGRVSSCIPPVFVGLMIPGFVLVYLTVPALISTLFPGISFAKGVDAPAAIGQAAQTYQWIDDVVPPNFFSAIVADNILGVIVVTLLIAFALRKTTAPTARLAAAAQIGVDAMFVIAGWLLRISPIVVFAAVVPLAAEGAAKLGGVLLAYVALEALLCLVLAGFLLFLAMAAFRGSPRRLLQSMAPSMIAALTTRSSLATLPLVIESAKRELNVDADIAGYVTSLAGALLKVSRSISSPTRLMVLGSVLAIPIGFQQYVGFCLTILVLSMSTSGVPKAVSGERSLSAFVAAGVPAGPATLLGSLTWATDPILTLVNTVSYLTATLWVSRVVSLSAARQTADGRVTTLSGAQ
ncbi:MAG: cation:dicarboxylase symporter family transporter [Gemmatimonas sp.]